MFEPKSELRNIATKSAAIVAALTTALSLTGCAPAQTEEQKQMLKYVESTFIDNSYVEGFTPGQADYGITMEMLLQRKALVDSSAAFKGAVSASLENSMLSGDKSNTKGYLFTPATDTTAAAIKIDLAGKFAFISAALKADNQATREGAVDLAEQSVASQPAITDFALAWLILGLDSNGREAKATEVAQKLIAAQDSDGGFDDYTPDASTSDATGLALQALAAVDGQGDSAQNEAVQTAISKALGYLTSTIVTDHWEAYDAINTNGTAYAYMGIKAVNGENDFLTTIRDWLKTQVMKDGGVQAGYALGVSNAMATSQAAAAISGLSYLDLLK